MTTALFVIPARLESKRLPDKMLLRLGDRTLIEAVVERVQQFRLARVTIQDVVVATDSEAIWDRLASTARVCMTSSDCRNGTERVAEVISREEYADVDVVVNIQGDQPFIHMEQIQGAVSCVLEDGFDVGTSILPLLPGDDSKENVVKVITQGKVGRHKQCLAFARLMTCQTQIGYRREFFIGEHVGVYAYSIDALRYWAGAEETQLEKALRLEQARAMALGLLVGGAYTYPTVEKRGFAIDTQRDLERARQRIAREKEPETSPKLVTGPDARQ